MKRLVAFLSILFASVLCTACINNFAIQELNNKAKAHLEKGDVEKAICRLQSSIDLDGNIFETRYNLGIAYIKHNDFKDAIEQLEAALKIKEVPEVYYSLGIAHEGLVSQMVEFGEPDDTDDIDDTIEEPKLEAKDIEIILVHLSDATKAYETYLEKAPEASDKEEVLKQIQSVKESSEEYKQKLEALIVE